MVNFNFSELYYLLFNFVLILLILIIIIIFIIIFYTSSLKHAYIMLNPLKPTFYIVKLGFTGVYIFFLISAQKHRLWVLVRTAGSNEYLQSMFRAEI